MIGFEHFAADEKEIDPVTMECHGQQLYDPFGGLEDTQSKAYKHIADKLNCFTENFCVDINRQLPLDQWKREYVQGNRWTPKFCSAGKCLITGKRIYLADNGKLSSAASADKPAANNAMATIHLCPRTLVDLDTICREKEEFDASSVDLLSIEDVFWSKSGKMFAVAIEEIGKLNTILFCKIDDTGAGMIVDGVLRDVCPHSVISWSNNDEGIFYKAKKCSEKQLYFHYIHSEQAEDTLIAFNFVDHEEGGKITKLTLKSELFLHGNLLFPVYLYWGIRFESAPNLRDHSLATYLDKAEIVYVLYDIMKRDKYADFIFCGFDPLDDDSFFVYTNWNTPMWALNRIPLGNANLADPTGWHIEIAERQDAVLDMCKVSNCGTFFLLAYIENVAERNLYVYHRHKRAILQRLNPHEESVMDIIIGENFWIMKTHNFLQQSPNYYQIKEYGQCEFGIKQIHFHYQNDDADCKKLETTNKNNDGQFLSDFQIERHAIEIGIEKKLPLVIVRRKEMEKDGTNSCILYGYGSFNGYALPEVNFAYYVHYTHYRGIFAIVYPRGERVHGQKWRAAGRLAKKQNAIDDYMVAVNFLIANGYTSPERLIGWGRSGGASLVTAAATQNPHKFAGIVAIAGRYDFIRHPAPFEYGDPKEKEDFKNLRSISPYENVSALMSNGEAISSTTTSFPSILLLCGQEDSACPPCGAIKYAMKICSASSSTSWNENSGIRKPILLVQIMKNKGHLDNYENDASNCIIALFEHLFS